MTKKEKEINEINEEVDTVDPMAATPGDASDLPAAWEKEGSNLPATVGDSADLERSDFITPSLKLIGKNGDKDGKFTPGTWVLNKEIQFTKAAGEPLQLVILENPVKFFQEHVQYDPDNQVIKKRFRTLEDVHAAGLTVDWDNVTNTPPTADRAARVILLILKPETYTGETGFGMTIEGLGNCAVASWLLANASAYKYAARRIFSVLRDDLNGRPIRSLLWTMRSELVKMGKFPVMAPIMMPTKTLSQEVQDTLKATFNLQ